MRRREQRYSMLSQDSQLTGFSINKSNGSNGNNNGSNGLNGGNGSGGYSSKGLLYSIVPDNRDAVFGSGVYSGRKVSDIVMTVEGRDFLGTVWKYGKRDLNSVIKNYFSD